MMLFGTTMVACNDNDEDGSKQAILKPIATHMLGKWMQEYAYMLENGEKTLFPMEENEGVIITYRADGTLMRQATQPPEGHTYLSVTPWTVDEDACTYTVGGTYPFTFVQLGENVMEYKSFQGFDSETGELIEGEIYWHYVRLDENERTMAELLAQNGRWTYAGSYKKEGGQWVEFTEGSPDEAWHELGENGIVNSCLRFGDQETKSEHYWSINQKTGELCFYTQDKKLIWSNRIELDGEDTFRMYYEGALDVESGGRLPGEYYDVYTLQ